MKGTPYMKGGGARTSRDNVTLHNLADRNDGPGLPGYEKKSTGGKGGDKYAGYGDQGKGNAAKRRMKKEELETTGLFSESELAGLEEKMSAFELVKQSMGNSYIDPKAPKKEKSEEDKKKDANQRAERRAAFAKKEHDRLYGKKND